MYLYKKEMYNDFKFPFDGLENIEQSYSQALQDMFVLSVLNGKRNGTFLEIGAYHASSLSNTYLLEKYYNWQGISIDIDEGAKFSFDQERSAQFVLSDATTLDYEKLLGESEVLKQSNHRVSYMQIDTEPMQNTLLSLTQIPLDKWRFSIVTYETDFYDPNTPREEAERVRKESRNILESHGYVLVNGNVENLGGDPFEDWYLDGEYFEKDIIKKFMRDSDAPIRARDYMLRNAV